MPGAGTFRVRKGLSNAWLELPTVMDQSRSEPDATRPRIISYASTKILISRPEIVAIMKAPDLW